MKTIIRTPSLKNFFDTNTQFPNPFGIALEDYNKYNSKNNFVPAVNVIETNEKFMLEFSAPGFVKEEFNISLEDNTITVMAEHKNEIVNNEKNYLRKEFTYKSFSRSFALPENIDSETLNAKYENGILNVIIPKKIEVKENAKKVIEVA